MKRTITIMMAAALLIACHNGNRAGQQSVRQETNSLKASYQHADSLYAVCGRIDTAAFSDFITRAMVFAEAHPQDTLAPGMLYRAGVGSMILAKSAETAEYRATNAKRALAIFNQFQEQFPEHENAKLCYWQRAIVYDDILGDWRSAESEYRDFINRFPNDSLTPVFQQYLTILGKSETEISSMYNVQ